MTYKKTQNVPLGLIIGRTAMADYCGVALGTIDNWRRRHGFPYCYLPDGRACTSMGLVDKWILERGAIQRKQKEDVRQAEQVLDGRSEEAAPEHTVSAQRAVPGAAARMVRDAAQGALSEEGG